MEARRAERGEIRIAFHGFLGPDPRLTPLNEGSYTLDGAVGFPILDTDYNEESFFVRYAYFLGDNDLYKALKTKLKAEIDANAWATLNSDTSRPFDKPKSGQIAVKVVNHLGDEVMKVFRVA